MAKRKTNHERLVEAALSAITNLFSDTTVSKYETEQSLRTIREDIEIKIDALRHG